MSHYSFPILKNQDILLCLSELSIEATEDDLVNPTSGKVQLMYSQFIEILLNQRREDMLQPSFSGIDALEYPELHEESVPTMGFLKSCHKLLSTSGISDFALHDITKPEYKRLRRNISAIINFAKFREERLQTFEGFTQQTEELAARKAALEEENERLVTEVNEANHRQQVEAPEAAALVAENGEREVVVRALWNRQTAVQKECQTLKAQLHEVQDAIKEANAKLLDAREEAQALKSQIVPDPKKLKHDLAALQDSSAMEKSQLKGVEAKTALNEKASAAVRSAERDVEHVLSAQAECEAEGAKLRDVRASLAEMDERGARDEGERNDQVHQIKGLSQRAGHFRERIERLVEAHGLKREAAEQALGEAQAGWAALNAERSQQARVVEDNDMALREIRDQLLKGQMDHEAEAARVQQQQQLLATQVRAYHADLNAEMRKVSAAQAAAAAAAPPVACS